MPTKHVSTPLGEPVTGLAERASAQIVRAANFEQLLCGADTVAVAEK